MESKEKEFRCNGKRLADYLTKHGCKILRMEDGTFIFEYQKSIDEALKQWEIDCKRCVF